MAKIKNNYQLNQIAKALTLEFEGLEVETRIQGTVADRWIQIAISGLDEEIAINYLIKEIGLCSNKLERVKKDSILKAYVVENKKSCEEIVVDVGVFQPEVIYATISLSNLQLQLLEGREIGIKRLIDLFCLREDFLINIRILDVNIDEKRIEAELSSSQIRKYVDWRESLLDRLIILGVPLNRISTTVKQTKLDRDIVNIETFGILEHALACKLGTDAKGLIPKIGNKLKNAKFLVFNPKKIRGFLNKLN